MDALTLLTQAHQTGLTVHAEGDRLVVRGPRSAEPLALKLLDHKLDLMRLLTAPEADCLSEEPCPICGSHERWRWLDRRLICRVCLILDLIPLTLMRSGLARPLEPASSCD
jgi:hypothetical protein